MSRLRRCLPLLIAYVIWLPLAFAQENPDERIVTPDEVREAGRSPGLAPIRIVSYPFRIVLRGMENGLVTVEKDHLRERLQLWQERLREIGAAGLFGGFGEQTGFGGGGSYTVGHSDFQKLTFLARGTFAHYQEFDARWTLSPPKTEFTLAASYQWRPKENFYGLGHSSLKSQHTDFALRESWIGARRSRITTARTVPLD